MKKLLFAALVATGIASSAFASATGSNNASVGFSSDFKGATNVSWKSTNDYNKASFVWNSMKMDAFYDNTGNLFAKSWAISIEELPDNAREFIGKEYCGYTTVESIRMEAEDGDAYYLSMARKNNTVVLKVDDDGNVSVLKSVKS